jgi:phosphatidylglycerol---prolipoprotein diacylglyceryl transferase
LIRASDRLLCGSGSLPVLVLLERFDVNGFAFPAIDPIALQIGPVAIRWYALAYIAGLFGGLYYAKKLATAARLWGAIKRPASLDLDDLLLWATLGVIAGGRLAYVTFYEPTRFLAKPIEVFAIWSGGMSFHGGLAGATLAIFLFARARQLPILSMFDLVATVAPIGLLFGRIANFINGELWGRATDVSWAVIFPHGGPIPRHPSQLYEAATEGLLLLLLLAFLVRRSGYGKPGLITGVFGAGYALSRIFCEFFREPDPQLGFLLGNWATMGMLLSLPMLIIGLWLIARARPATAS